MYRQLRETVRTEHQGMVIISHNLRQLLRWADRIVVLRDGRLVEVTTPSAMMDGQCHAYSQALWRALPENWGHPLC
ncbi:dipeptide transport ATP-binding protein DppD [Photobacterium aphoticum]|uniref:Dipeptide transport ATP-binding protein DppD n=1 Tax=Photobacterium aphoticum TaxID=754436 RepID=A0A090RFB4_9GAMM|nr:dipeptide transport ATP-binding protein DppD [Photobacterium aphoticum]